MQLIRFQPIYKERVWGGRALEIHLNRDLPPGRIVGESWDLVDREEDQSVAIGGVFNGKTIREIISDQCISVMGSTWSPEKRFPILVKWLDCQQKLSLQVHPPTPIANQLGGEPKTENWYILQAQPRAGLLVGLRRGTTRNEFEKAVEENRLQSCVHRIPSRAGDSILVGSGRLHAIEAGNLILEIQQNSDTTYRVYDWGRSGLDGKPRELHLRESILSIDFDDFEPTSIATSEEPGETILADCSEFRIRKHNLAVGTENTMDPKGIAPEILHVTKGKVLDRISGEILGPGDTVLLPAQAKARLQAVTDCSYLHTDRFA